jgi:hypothetical protein
MFKVSRILSSTNTNTIKKVTSFINDIGKSNKSLNVVHNKYNEHTNNVNFVVLDNELKNTYHGQINISNEYRNQNFELVKNNVETNKDDDLFEFEMSIKNALKN